MKVPNNYKVNMIAKCITILHLWDSIFIYMDKNACSYIMDYSTM